VHLLIQFPCIAPPAPSIRAARRTKVLRVGSEEDGRALAAIGGKRIEQLKRRSDIAPKVSVVQSYRLARHNVVSLRVVVVAYGDDDHEALATATQSCKAFSKILLIPCPHVRIEANVSQPLADLALVETGATQLAFRCPSQLVH